VQCRRNSHQLHHLPGDQRIPAVRPPQGGLTDVISAYTDEYRHADYPVWADRSGLVEVHKDGDLYRKFEASASWYGSADSNPARVAKDACWH
jgi:hypothetical protein